MRGGERKTFEASRLWRSRPLSQLCIYYINIMYIFGRPIIHKFIIIVDDFERILLLLLLFIIVVAIFIYFLICITVGAQQQDDSGCNYCRYKNNCWTAHCAGERGRKILGAQAQQTKGVSNTTILIRANLGWSDYRFYNVRFICCIIINTRMY